MDNNIRTLFEDSDIVRKIQNKLPKLFHLAELESSRAGKVGMEVGSLREKILVALFIYKFGEENVETQLPITEPEVDVKVFGNPISIKTYTGSGYSGVKIIWTVDAESSRVFQLKYQPSCDIIFVKINWSKQGGVFYIPIEVQKEVFNKLGRTGYIKLPKEGTNPRGVEINPDALRMLLENKKTLSIKIDWAKETINFNVFNRWVELWAED